MTLKERLVNTVNDYARELTQCELTDGNYVQPTLKQLTEIFAQVTSFYGMFVEEYAGFIEEAAE